MTEIVKVIRTVSFRVQMCIIKPFKVQSRLQQTTFMNRFSFFSEKIRLDVSSESSARQRIHMNNQVLFSSKDKK